MATYDPDRDYDPRSGVSAFEFPITLYDRPQLAFANIALRGDVDAATKALFSPQQLTPTELQSFKSKLLGKNPNPILGTIVDIASNPLVILGLAAAYLIPVATGKKVDLRYLVGLTEGMGGKAKKMTELFSGLHPAMVNLRDLPKVMDGLLKATITNAGKQHEWSEKMANVFHKWGKLTHDESVLLSAYLDGLHKGGKGFEHALSRQYRKGMNQGSILQSLYESNAGPAANLEAVMSPKLKGMARDIRGVFNDIIKEFPESKLKKVQAELRAKGIMETPFGQALEDYFPRQTGFDYFENIALKDIMTKKESYDKILDTIMNKPSRALLRRVQFSVPGSSYLEDLTRLGAMPAGVLEEIKAAQTVNLARVKGNLAGTIEFLNKRVAAGEITIDRAMREFAGLYSPLLNTSESFEVLQERLGKLSTKTALKKMKRAARAFSQNKAYHAIFGQASGALARKDMAMYDEMLNRAAASIGAPASYSYDFRRVVPRYIKSMASTFSWHMTDASSQINEAMWAAKRVLGGPGTPGHLDAWQERYIRDMLIPYVRGMRPYQSFQRAANWADTRFRMLRWVSTNPQLKKSLDSVSPNSHKWLVNYLSDTSPSMTAESIGGAMSRYFYLSTLGLNMSSTTKNLLQNFITVANMPGIGHRGLLKGLYGVGEEKGLLDRMGKYVAEAAKGGWSAKARETAFRKHFKDFVESLGEGSSILDSMMAGDLIHEGSASPQLAFTMWEKAKRGMLAPFSASETFNRLLGYYAGKTSYLANVALTGEELKAGKTLMGEAAKAGRNVVMMAHFPGGPLGMPKALLDMSSPLRQFMHFPARYGSFLHASSQWPGGMMRTVGKTAAGSAAIYEIAKNLGVDLSTGLMTGALPLPQYEGAPFHPFPLVPPVVGMAGSAAMALYSGDTRALRTTASLAVPGGIALQRLIHTVSPKYAGYGEKTPDGKIPIYNDQHSLVGTLTPFQLFLRSMGLKPSSISAEEGAAKWVLAQRDRIRGYRREWMQAIAENDNAKVEKIQKEFMQEYPELGPLQMKKTDIKALHDRREISRLNRIMKGLPRGYQPLFQNVLNEAALTSYAGNLPQQEFGFESAPQ